MSTKSIASPLDPVADSQKKKVSFYSKLDRDITIAYGNAHLIIPPRGKVENLDLESLDMTKLPVGIISKIED